MENKLMIKESDEFVSNLITLMIMNIKYELSQDKRSK